jgi:hypothetical protein
MFQYSLSYLTLFTLAIWSFVTGFTLAPIASGSLPVVFFTGACLAVYLWTTSIVLKKLLTFSPWSILSCILFFPVTLPLLPLIALRSAGLFIYHGGIYWRGAFYARSELIKGQRLKPIDLAFARLFRAKA